MLQLNLPGGMQIAPPQGFNIAGNTNPEVGIIVGELIPYVMIFASLILFFLLTFGGFTLLTSAGNPETVKKGQQMIVSGLIGFAIIFTSYWIMQLLQIILGLKLGF